MKHRVIVNSIDVKTTFVVKEPKTLMDAIDKAITSCARYGILNLVITPKESKDGQNH